MGFIYALRSEQEKTKHTSFWAIHFCVPVMGALLFLAYYSLYASTADSKKLKMILEITTTFFPLLISVIVGLNVTLEEKASHFQTLLAVPNRHKNMLAKLTYLYGSGVFALFFLFLLFVIGIHLLGMADTVQLGMLIGAAAGMAFCNFIIYILHLFLSFKFGLGLSLSWGVFESLQCILYSNIELKGVARYIPFAWSMNWVQDNMHDRIIIRNMVSQISIEYEKESDITARKELIKRGERYAADRTMFLRDINIYDDRVYQQDESIVCSASFPVIGSYAGMSDICNISENVNKIDNARLIRKTNALMEVVG